MGIIYDCRYGWVEARTESIIIGIRENETFEIDYKDLEILESLVKKAQKVRRDMNRMDMHIWKRPIAHLNIRFCSKHQRVHGSGVQYPSCRFPNVEAK